MCSAPWREPSGDAWGWGCSTEQRLDLMAVRRWGSIGAFITAVQASPPCTPSSWSSDQDQTRRITQVGRDLRRPSGPCTLGCPISVHAFAPSPPPTLPKLQLRIPPPCRTPRKCFSSQKGHPCTVRELPIASEHTKDKGTVMNPL